MDFFTCLLSSTDVRRGTSNYERSPDYKLVPSVQEATSETRVSHPLSFPYGSVYISVEVSQRQKGGKVKLY